MVVRFVLWNLADSKTNLEELRTHLRPEPRAAFHSWISDESTERFGAISVWESYDDEQPVLQEVRDLIGTDPEIAELFDVEG
jgi:hypothetical protein